MSSYAIQPSPIPVDARRPVQYRAGDLIIEHRAQRDVNEDRVGAIVAEFDWALMEAPTVVETSRGIAVIEGQHRARAVQALDASALVWCMLLPSAMTLPEQAQLALDITKRRRPHTAYEAWFNAVQAEHEHEVLSMVVLDELGLRLGRKATTMTIAAVGAVRHIVHGGAHSPEFGAELLHKVLTTVLAAWPTYDHDSTTSRWSPHLLRSVEQLWVTYPELDPDRLVRVLRSKPAAQWIAAGTGLDEGPPYVRIADKVRQQYNRGLKSRKLR